MNKDQLAIALMECATQLIVADRHKAPPASALERSPLTEEAAQRYIEDARMLFTVAWKMGGKWLNSNYR